MRALPRLGGFPEGGRHSGGPARLTRATALGPPVPLLGPGPARPRPRPIPPVPPLQPPRCETPGAAHRPEGAGLPGVKGRARGSPGGGAVSLATARSGPVRSGARLLPGWAPPPPLPFQSRGGRPSAAPLSRGGAARAGGSDRARPSPGGSRRTAPKVRPGARGPRGPSRPRPGRCSAAAGLLPFGGRARSGGWAPSVGPGRERRRAAAGGSDPGQGSPPPLGAPARPGRGLSAPSRGAQAGL